MKTIAVAIALFLSVNVFAADLPTVSVEHLYYLKTRGDHVRNFNSDEMIEYCVAQKIGGDAFVSLYSQIFSMRLDLTKMLKVEEVQENDPRVTNLKKTQKAYTDLLREEAQRVRNGIMREGQIADDTLTAIARAQQSSGQH